MHTTTFSLAPSPRLVAQRLVADVAARWCGALDRHRRRRAMRATLASLDGLDRHLLRDLGLDRSELPSVAAEAAGLAARHRLLVPRW
jgi:uncharacterized protein YjiS (DUF1127 family)